jgi:hypothetical protein
MLHKLRGLSCVERGKTLLSDADRLGHVPKTFEMPVAAFHRDLRGGTLQVPVYLGDLHSRAWLKNGCLAVFCPMEMI